MRNLKLGLFTMLAMITAGIGFTAAFEIQVGPQDYYGTLTLNRINIMKNNSITGIVLDGTGYSIKIGQGSDTDTGSIRVRQICDRSGNNCKLISEISTGNDGIEITNVSDNSYCKYIATGYDRRGNVSTPAHIECLTTNPYTLPLASDTVTGGIKLYSSDLSDKNYRVKLDTNGKAFVSVPWTDNYTNSLIIQGSGTEAISFTQNANKTLNIKGSGNVSVSVGNKLANSADIIITSTGGGGTSLRQTSGTDFIKPKNDSYNVTIGDIKIKTGDNGGCSTNQLIPGIIYTDQFFIRSSNYGGGCGIASKPIVMDSSGHVAINASLNESYATVIGGTTEINGSVTVEGEIVATSTLNTPSAVHTTSATINGNKFQNNKVGIQKTPGASGEPLQINGGIQVSNYSTPTMNDTCSIEGAIEYYNGYFYGCAKKGNTSAKRARLSIYFQEGQVNFD